ncbi:hypothetical protein CVT24_002653 [Panaeolus cyanescens]|uniref:Uncharacterized protein n=1 Tax=Panaeolus cyanescens TaxID=181874 RepID=A0A409WPT1_9AGAR|nr:hypothetical protein CVT24_002653 [Panaeolus cyanescens]
MSLVASIITSATRQELLFNHNQDFTQLTIEHTQLQARYEELWKCYCAILKEKCDSTPQRFTPSHQFDPHTHIPEIIPDSDPPSPFHNSAPFLGFTKPPLSKPSANLTMPLFDASNEVSDGSTTEEDSDDMDSDWETFKREYERRRREKVAKAGAQTSESNSKLERKLAVFIDQMDKKYPSHTGSYSNGHTAEST